MSGEIVDPTPTTPATASPTQTATRQIPIDNNRPCGPCGFLPGGLSDAGLGARG
jgi:hypothetical protein